MEHIESLEKNNSEKIKIILDDLENINSESSDFYHNIINISAKNPDLTELIRFIVEIYDKIDNKNKNSNTILREAFLILINENIENKKKLNNIINEMKTLKIELENFQNFQVEQSFSKPEDIPYNYNENQNSKTNSFSLLGLINQIIEQVKNNQMFYITIICLALIIGMILSPENIILLLKEIREFFKN